MSDLEIHKRYVLNHAPEAVFDIWVSPDGVVAPVTAIEAAHRVGGVFKLTVGGEHDSFMIGEFLVFDRPRKLVYTWEWNADGEVSQVRVAFNALDGGTEVILDHVDSDKASSRETHDGGWDSYVTGITRLLEDGD